VAFYKAKQVRRGGEEVDYVQAIKISPAEGVFVWFYLSFRVTDISLVEIAICEYSSSLRPTESDLKQP
jgi:hypothetical protein